MLVQGEAELAIESDGIERVATMALFESFPLAPGVVHRLMGNGTGGGLVLEVSTLELNDVVCIDDDYGRSGT